MLNQLMSKPTSSLNHKQFFNLKRLFGLWLVAIALTLGLLSASEAKTMTCKRCSAVSTSVCSSRHIRATP